MQPGVSLQRAGDEAILHDRVGGQAHVINATAAHVWELADGQTIDELATALATAYDQPIERVDPDVRRIVARFGELGVLTLEP